jgi:hypothetical protein
VSDCRHGLDLCPDCGGLRLTESFRLEVADIRMEGPAGHHLMDGPAIVRIDRLPGPCPNVSIKESNDVRRD